MTARRSHDSRSAGEAGPDAVTVRLPRALLRLFHDAPPMVTLSATTVAEIIDELDIRWPGMRDRLCDSRPAVRRHVNVFVEGQRASLETRLSPGTVVTILTAISGG